MRVGAKSPHDVLAAYGFQTSSRSSSAMDSQSRRDLLARTKKNKGSPTENKKDQGLETFAEVLEHLSKR